MTYDKGVAALYEGYYNPDFLEQVSKMMNSMRIGSAQIRDLAVKNAHIQDLKTDKLVAGEIKISPSLLDDDYVNGIYTSFSVLEGMIESEITVIEGDIGSVSSRVTQLADSIESEVIAINTELGVLGSTITQTASSIRSEVDSAVRSLDGDITSANSRITQTSNSLNSTISSEVSRLDGRVNSSNSSITQLSNQISSKITSGDARSIFIQEANSFTFSASQINFAGQVFGTSTAKFLGTIETNQNIKIGTTLNFGYGYISSNTFGMTLSGYGDITLSPTVNSHIYLGRNTILSSGYNLLFGSSGSGSLITRSSSGISIKFNASNYITIKSGGIDAYVNGAYHKLA